MNDLIDVISREEWNTFFSNYRISGEELNKIFPYRANYYNLKSILEHFLNYDEIFNNDFNEILRRFPNSLSREERTSLLQYFLVKDGHHSHEDILFELKEYFNEDNLTINYLLELISNLPSFYREDEDLKYPFIRKVIYTIGAQPEPDSINAINSLKNLKDKQIDEYIIEQIEYRKKRGRWEALENKQDNISTLP